ncbi:hypothetical protein C497_06364 [Halalkalicoccus jeotgali B3]|uniref:Uncharacterized protein n=1 Tax=Halalkalicoccus jeotgali (strain DSM 18796 / CECT 7217 / JCM 14584 / KCTC 4019 / B3) TaxID=795797 RepID=D8JCE3_HALJB|nr:hypothetical protein HacjB3_18538 [Halalkalicoccus jeotgali B3]ELY38784.1 hypothetical protein C497_06364 [Halalkalicoccus jeotgali B3]
MFDFRGEQTVFLAFTSLEECQNLVASHFIHPISNANPRNIIPVFFELDGFLSSFTHVNTKETFTRILNKIDI